MQLYGNLARSSGNSLFFLYNTFKIVLMMNSLSHYVSYRMILTLCMFFGRQNKLFPKTPSEIPSEC